MTRRNVPKSLWFATAAVVLIGAAAWGTWWFWPGEPYEPPAISFAGTSDKLNDTLIVPTLDTPVPEKKSVVWCSSFQIAWNELRNQFAKEPIRLKNAQETADRLNQAPQSQNDLAADSAYAAAGRVADGILEKIRQEMAKRFPKEPMPEMPGAEDFAVVSFAHVSAGVKFTHKYFDIPDGLEFTDSSGKKTQVQAFGIPRDKINQGDQTYRAQINILHNPDGAMTASPKEFILDLDKKSEPNQLVLARVPWQGTLQKTLADVTSKIAAFSPMGIGKGDRLSVPVMHWKITHHFHELEGPDKVFLNPGLSGLYLAAAVQTIHFQLDRSGAGVTSSSWFGAKSVSRNFYFDQPFLIYLKKRDATHPFFVMWVENAEVLLKT